MGDTGHGWAWKGGRTVASTGYVLVRLPGHPMADVRGYVYEHRLVASEKVGRLLQKREIVHHLNGDKQDNRPENLAVLPSIAHHMQEHGGDSDRQKIGAPNEIVICACGCGSAFQKFDASRRPRRYVTGHNPRNQRGEHVG